VRRCHIGNEIRLKCVASAALRLRNSNVKAISAVRTDECEYFDMNSSLQVVANCKKNGYSLHIPFHKF